MKNEAKCLWYTLFWIALCMLFSMPALAQTQGSITVTGYVKDATGESLIGATVQVKGVTGGTITDVMATIC